VVEDGMDAVTHYILLFTHYLPSKCEAVSSFLCELLEYFRSGQEEVCRGRRTLKAPYLINYLVIYLFSDLKGASCPRMPSGGRESDSVP